MEMLDLFSINIKYLEYDFKFNKSIVRKARSPEPWFLKNETKMHLLSDPA